jgi:hypothetical protein
LILKYDEKNTEGYLQMAIVSNFARNYKNAVAAAQKGLEIEKRALYSAQLAYQLAYAYEHSAYSTPEKACEYYQKAAATTDNIIKQTSKDAMKRMRCKTKKN